MRLRNNKPEREVILHEEYNPGHAVSSIPNAVRREKWREPSQQEVQQKPIVYLLLASPMGWESGISASTIEATAPSSEPTYGVRVDIDTGYAATKSQPWCCGIMAQTAKARLYTACLFPLSGAAPAKYASGSEGEKEVRGQAIPANGPSGGADTDRREGCSAPMYH